ncbi:MAG: hypothetical protein JW384_01066 [Nitrosomonadaceae bacterium]|nr:hypothetical protein [Nitrosomonadaceae bacterium]
MCLMWWGVGIWLYWGQSPQFDESTYLHAAFSWLDFDFSHLAAGEMGTLVRPYIYPLFIAVVLNTSTSLLDDRMYIRIIVSLIQLILYVSSVMRLSQIVLASFDRNASNAVLVGLLATPFPIFTQVEILSEGLSMSAFCWLAGALIRLDDRSIALRQLPRRGLVILLMVILVLIRSSFLPVALMTALWVILPVILLIGNQEVSKQWWRLIVAVPVVTVGLLVAVPQTYLMVEHARIVREDPYFWGVGGSQLHWSMNVAKYSTSMIDCASLTRGGIKYTMPELVNWLSFSDELIWESSANVILWDLSHPLAFIIHVFEAINYDFPTAYVTLVNWPLMILFNIFSIYIFSVGKIYITFYFKN